MPRVHGHPRCSRAVLLATTLALSAACAQSRSTPAAPATAARPDGARGVLRIQADARRLEPLVREPFTKRFLAATNTLPHIETRTIFHDATKTQFFTRREAGSAPDASLLIPYVVTEGAYYETKYGSPLSYARPLDVLAQSGATLGATRRVLDFGFGYIGHLRLLATLGFDAVGVDVDPMLRALYSEPGDQGPVSGQTPPGRVRIVIGKFPVDPRVRAEVGRGFDVIVSKNTLKRGYIHPERYADPKVLIDLGASDADVLAAFFDALTPGGTMLVYNVCPAPTPPDKPFVPWSDGRSPFSEVSWRAAGFDVLAFDRDDTAVFRSFARALGWGDDPDEPWDIEHDLSVIYTLVRKPAG